MILAALIMGLLAGLVILDETDTERPDASPAAVPAKSRREPARRSDIDRL
jgi:hypothetical protein